MSQSIHGFPLHISVLNFTKWQTGLPHEGAKEKCIVFVSFWYSAVQLMPSQATVCGSAHRYEPLQWSSREYSPHPPYPPTLWRICSNFWGLVEIDTPASTKWVPVGNALKSKWLLSDAKVSNMAIEGPQTGGKGFCTGLFLGFSARTSWRSTSRLSPIALINCQCPACKLIPIFSAKQISNCRYFLISHLAYFKQYHNLDLDYQVNSCDRKHLLILVSWHNS